MPSGACPLSAIEPTSYERPNQESDWGWTDLEMVEVYARLMPRHPVPEISQIWGRSHPRIGDLPAPAVDEGEAEDDAREAA